MEMSNRGLGIRAEGTDERSESEYKCMSHPGTGTSQVSLFHEIVPEDRVVWRKEEVDGTVDRTLGTSSFTI